MLYSLSGTQMANLFQGTWVPLSSGIGLPACIHLGSNLCCFTYLNCFAVGVEGGEARWVAGFQGPWF